MDELTKAERIIYKAIEELLKESPDGELTYTKILTCYLNGKANEEIPWSAIQKSKVYGKLPKTNTMSVLMACTKLESLGYLRISKIDGNYKYFVTLTKPRDEEKPKIFSAKLSKYKKYLLDTFLTYMSSYCSSIKGVEHEDYYGFINKNPISFNEYNWFWINDESKEQNALKVFLRYRPNMKAVSQTYDLSYNTFKRVLEEITDALEAEKEVYKLDIHPYIKLPIIEKPIVQNVNNHNVPEECDFSFFDNNGDDEVYINDGGKKATNASLSVSESSPYKYGGDTLFAPRALQKQVQGKLNFEFSFLKWKVIAWTTDKDNQELVQNVLLVSKKAKESWIVLSLPKRKIVCLTNLKFKINIDGKEYSNEELIKEVFKD